MAHRACVIIWVCLGVHGTCVSGGADDKEDMIRETLRVAGFIIALVLLGMALQGLTNFIRPITW